VSVPPWPHNPNERIPIGEVLGWELRVVPRTEPTHKFLIQQELLQLQFWHPDAKVSLLTPSPAIRGCPVHQIAGWTVLNAPEPKVRSIVRSFGLPLPALSHIEALVQWHVYREYRMARTAAAATLKKAPLSFELVSRDRKLR